jgi:hypothetical protein
MMDIYLIVDREPAMYEGECDSVNILGIFNNIEDLLKTKYSKDAKILLIPEESQNQKFCLDINSYYMNDLLVKDLGYYPNFYEENKHLLKSKKVETPKKKKLYLK